MLTQDRIIEFSANHFGFTLDELKVKHGTKGAKRRELAIARQITMNALRVHTNLTIKSIGEIFNRDHTTVINAFKVVKDFRFIDRIFEREYSEYERQLCEMIELGPVNWIVEEKTA